MSHKSIQTKLKKLVEPKIKLVKSIFSISNILFDIFMFLKKIIQLNRKNWLN